jgi:hypothetical protein
MAPTANRALSGEELGVLVLGQLAKYRCLKGLDLRCLEHCAESHLQDAGLGYYSFPGRSE